MKPRSSERIGYSQFSNPDAFYWPGYIWFWNDRITARTLRSQLRDMHARKAKSVWPFAWPNFRPTMNPTSMSPDYLSREFLRLYAGMIREAARLGMKVWLYDEGGWPSGSVCGRLVRKHPELGQQCLVRKELFPKQGEKIDIPSDCISAFLYCGRALVKQLKPSEKMHVCRKNTRLLIFQSYRFADAPAAYVPYPDLLNPKATGEFLKLTHEKYRKIVGKHFGNTIPLVFADEPKATNPPWNDGLIEDFKRAKGYDIAARLPSIFEGASPRDMQVRIDYFDWWTNRFAEAFFGQIQKWCQKHRLYSTGHLGGEDVTLGPIRYGFGHPLRMYRKMDIPGVDTIWRQIFPGKQKVMNFPWGKSTSKVLLNVNHFFPKYASSVAHQQAKPWVITESFCVYGSGLTPAQMKWVTDFQYVRGVNIMTMGAYSLSTRDHYMGGQRPGFGPFNPLWKYMDVYHAYTARLSYLLSQGKPDVQAAVYYPIRDIWAKGPDLQAVADSNDRLVRILLENQADFDFIDDDVLESKTTRVESGRLIVGAMSYGAVFLSRTRWISQDSLKVLRRFAAAGGKVVWVDAPDDAIRIPGASVVSVGAVKKFIAPLVRVEPAKKTVRVCRRRLTNGNLYFVTHEKTGNLSCSIHFPEQQSPLVLDVETGACFEPAGASRTPQGWKIPLKLAFAQSVVLLFGRVNWPVTPQAPMAGKTVCRLSDGWSVRILRTFKIGRRNFETQTHRAGKRMATKLGNWGGKVGEGFSGDVEYEIKFDCDERMLKQARALDLGKVCYACEVVLNGEKIGKKLWPPYRLPVSGRLRRGTNTLKVVVTNTMANQFVKSRVLDKWPDNVIGPYHGIAKLFESDSMASGLFGPVSLI